MITTGANSRNRRTCYNYCRVAAVDCTCGGIISDSAKEKFKYKNSRCSYFSYKSESNRMKIKFLKHIFHGIICQLY